MTSTEKLDSFVKYHLGFQDNPNFEQAYHEISVKKQKQTHWIWYIIPYDKCSHRFGDLFALLNSKEVNDFANNTYLKNNYITIMSAIFEHLSTISTDEYDSFISVVDLKKIYESALLFRNFVDMNEVCDNIISVLKEFVAQNDAMTKNKRLLHNELQLNDTTYDSLLYRYS